MPFRIALSGLNAASADLKVTGNNIANSATVGFKRSRAEFVDVYAAAYGAIGSITPGSGVRTANLRQIFSQGNIEYTDNSTDLAITGKGFFVVEDDKGRYLTRNGTFGVDRNLKVVNSTGQTLQIFPPVTVGTTTTFNTGSLVDLQLQNTVGTPQATTRMNVSLNVDADNATTFDVEGAAAYGTIPVNSRFNANAGTQFDPTDPNTFTPNHLTAQTVYDSLGGSHVVQIYFRKLEDSNTVSDDIPDASEASTWQTYVYLDGNPLQPSSTGVAGGAGVNAAPNNRVPAVIGFAGDGTVLSSEYPDGAGTPQATTVLGEVVYEPFATTTGSLPVQISIDFGSITQFGSDFAVNEVSQDGFSTGRLTGFDVEDNGVVFARYTDGNKEVLGMTAMASVANPQGLRQQGDSLWTETFDAGDTVLGQPGTASLGLIQAGALEASTVEIADELVSMIVAQRAYQANAQVISTADQLTQTLLNIR